MAHSRVCSIPDCGNPHLARSLCRAHYLKLWKRGDPLAPPIPGKRRTTAQDRFKTRYKIDPASGCWEWQYSLTRKGYALFSVDGRHVSAHRFSYELHRGPIPEGLVMDHVVCANRRCVNPHHLEAVTSAENTLRGDGPPAVNARKTHCIRGHLLSGENVYIQRGRHRGCRQCRKDHGRENMRRRRAKQREASGN